MSGPERKRDRTHAQAPNSVRSKLNDQLSKLQVKHNAEVEFLEDMRSFTKQRSAIEKEYAQGLQRLTQQFMCKREIKTPPEAAGFDRTENRGLLEIWKLMLEKTDDLAKHRLKVAEMMLTQISEEMRQQRRIKEQTFKRCFEVAQKMNNELLESVKEMTLTKKTYGDLEKVCEDVRQKFSESEQRLRKKDLKFFESLTSLEKSHRKSSDRLKSCQKRTAVGRNDYLLAIETTNAHLKRHNDHDLPQLMQVMDGELYDKAREAYMKYAQIEADFASVVRAEMEDLREQAYLVNREYVLECFVFNNPVIREDIVYKFEPYGQDQVCGLTRDLGAEIFLDKDARKLASKLIKDQTSIAARQRQIKGLQSVTTAYTKNPEFGTSDAQAEVQQNIETLREEIRQFEVLTTKTEARLEALRRVGIDVSKWMQKAEEQCGSQELLSVGGSNRQSTLSLNSGSQEFDTASLRDDMISVTSESPKRCIVLYSYKAQRSDELDIHTDDELEILEWDDGDGWCKGRDRGGREGYFPQSYVQPSSRSPSPPHSGQGGQQQQCLSSSSAKDTNNNCNGNVTMLYAMYEYTAQYDEELSFPEGARIELLRTDDNGIDDGWWEGRYEGKVGVFPSVVVEILSNDSESPIGSSVTPSVTLPPPLDSPPPVPPNYPPPTISPADLGIGTTGPSPIAIRDTSPVPNQHFFSQVTPRNTPRAVSSSLTPKVTINKPTPEGTDLDTTYHSFRIDSFDDYDDEVSVV